MSKSGPAGRVWQDSTADRPAYLSAGDPQDPAVVLLHGATMDSGLFADQMPALENRFRILAIDFPGHGRSRALTFSMAACVDAVTAVLDRERIASCHLIGQSMGGIVAQLVMQRRPGLALSLTLIGSVPQSAPLYRLKAPAFGLAALIIRIAPISFSRGLIARLAGAKRRTRDYIGNCLQKLDKPDLTVIVGELRGALKAGPYPAPGLPVLIITGSRDLIALGLDRLLLMRWSKQSAVSARAVRGASHNANMDQPEAVNDLILAHIERV